MDYKELNKRNNILKKEIEKNKRLYIKSNTSFKKGDIVEYIHPGDSYRDEPAEYYKGEIYRFYIDSDGEMMAEIGNHYDAALSEIKIFKKDNYEFRDRVYGIPDLRVGDEFYITRNKARTTKGKKYKVYKVIEDGDGCEYWFYNDRNQPATTRQGEYRIEL